MNSILLAMVLVFLSVTLLIWSLRHLSVSWAQKYQETFTTTAKANLFDLFLFIEPKQLFWMNVFTLLTVPVIGRLFFGSWILGFIFSIVLAFIPRFAYRFLHQRRRRKFVHQLPDALNMVASSMQSGANLSSAIEFMAEESEAPLKQEFQLFLRQQRLGVEFNTALSNMYSRIPEDEFQLVVAGMQISRDVGGNLAEVLLRLSDTLRKKIEMEGKINSLTAQGKMQGLVMTALPLFIGLVLYHMEPEAMSRLFSEPVGWGVIVMVIFMLSFGYLAIKKIVTIDV
ncbi:type II secretion system F family protein [Shewanella corallii]|uniref:Type II secretion system F family protein n=1 Tax=Shewanella corallii TaxID=560080 RepID=A0ABT0N6V1_9GAMM|nr:type II secretion system F family protein [Shewanella corallii]MCL2913865.1 type II secretion system F family protein [Shewanella corallii]